MKLRISGDHVLGLLLVAPFVVAMNWGPSTSREVVSRLQDPEIVEASGLVVRDGLIVTHNDSGDTGRVFVVDPRNGETVGATAWGEAEDVEAVAPAGEGSVWVGDIGDNVTERESVTVRRVPVGRGDRTVAAGNPAYSLVYPDGPHDAEALLTVPDTGRLLVATKQVLGGVLYAAPERLDPQRPNRLRPLADVMGLVTDGAFFPDGRHLVLRNYERATVYSYPGLDVVGSFRLPSQPQGEGIAVDEQGEVYLSSEGQRSEVLHVEVPDEIARLLGPASADPSRSPGPLATTIVGERPVWPWLLSGALGVLIVVVLVRSLRPPSRARRRGEGPPTAPN